MIEKKGIILIVGGSSGVGDAVSCGFPESGEDVYILSRSEPSSLGRQDSVNRNWIKCDLSQIDSVEDAIHELSQFPIRFLFFSAGTWETDRDITKSSPREIYNIVSTNTSSFVALVAGLAKQLKSIEGSKVVCIASTAALENSTGPRAAYAASKFGLRGAIHSLREIFRDSKVAVTCINPGGLASDIDFDAGEAAALKKYQGNRIPSLDIIKLLRAIDSLSLASCVKEITIPAMSDRSV